MSHITSIKVVINDLNALATAAEECGCELVVDQTTFRWYGSGVDYRIKAEDRANCLHAIRVKNNSTAYEIGVMKNPNGQGFTLAYDSFCGGYGLEEIVGNDAVKIKQLYSFHAVKNSMKGKGFYVRKTWNENDSIQVEFYKI
jgi:hypothetical protein